jgi:hypothetical protein
MTSRESTPKCRKIRPVRERDLGRVERVAGVLKGLRGPYVDHLNSCAEEAEQLGQRATDPGVPGADHDERRVVEVDQAGPLTQELRAHRRTEAEAVRGRRLGQNPLDDLVHGARRDRAADDDAVEARRRRRDDTCRLGDITHRPADVGEIRAAARGRRRTHTDQ